ncbi:hypothetical protein R3P38DRAFT_2818370 [Favolaschia claudopus]|uniref:MYND-type domain-containing protein n=1 Tax=Favolaschia claudopus TaxID=2862362 RepID=A0AAW0EH47_9AGAR
MHQALEAKNLDKLGEPHRTRAKTAYESDRTLQDVQRVVKDFQNESSPSTRLLYLPVLYQCLVSVDRPSSQDLRTRSHAQTRVACAALSLRAIFTFSPSDTSAKSLWNELYAAVWPWIEFLDHNIYDLSKTIDSPQRLAYAEFIIFMGRVCETEDSVMETCGFCSILGESWRFLEQSRRTKAFDSGLYYLAFFLGRLDFTRDEDLLEIAEGAGGDLDNLARLVVEYLGYLAKPMRDPSLCGFFLRSIVSFIPVLRKHADTEYYSINDVDPASHTALQKGFIESLLKRGVLPAFVKALNSLLRSTEQDTEWTCRVVLHFLGYLLDTSKPYRWLPDSIRAGLLLALARIYAGCTSAVADSIHFLMGKLLPDNLIYYHVVIAVGEALGTLRRVVDTKEFEELEMFDMWDAFVGLAERRLVLARRLNEVDSIKLKACDNLACGKIRSRSKYQRCSGCNAFYYCDRTCQRADWQEGGHQNMCTPSSTISLTESSSCELGFRERQFLRALMHEEYQQSLLSICDLQVVRLSDSDDSEEFFTLFDFTHTPVQISLESIGEDSVFSNTLRETSGVEWTNLLARMRESQGRMQLHVIKVGDGSDMGLWVVPLRSSSSTLVNALVDYAKGIPQRYDEEEIVDDLRMVLNGVEEGLVEIH